MKCRKCKSEAVKITWSPFGVRRLNCNGCDERYIIPPELHGCERCSKIEDAIDTIETLKKCIKSYFEMTGNPNISKDIILEQYKEIMEKLKS